MSDTTLTLVKEPMLIGKNVKAAKTADGMLVLIIDMSKNVGVAKSGSGNVIIATTSGNVSVGEAKLGLNLYTKPTNNLD